MIIESNEKFTKEEIDEIFDISVRRTLLYKSPEKKMHNVFEEGKKNLLIGIALIVFICILGFLTDFDIFTIVAITLSAVITFICILWLFQLNKSYKENRVLLEKTSHSKIEYTEEFIGVEMENGTSVKIKWSEIAFIKVFGATFGVFASDKTRALVIPMRYWETINGFMKENNVSVNAVYV